MKRSLKILLAGVICVFFSSVANADDMHGKHDKNKHMNEHHQFIDDLLILIKDINGTMKEISADEKIKVKADLYSKRLDDLLSRHSKMKEEEMSGGHKEHMEHSGDKK